MPTTLNVPVFCLTSDVDWASEDAIGEFLALAARYGIKPTMFATHASPRLEEARQDGSIDLGIHPNFLPGSTHGDTPDVVIDHMCALFPQATSFRAHAFFDDTPIAAELVRRGFTHDSNLCLYLQSDLVPLRHWTGLVRFPVFWEDDVHWLNTGGDWELERYFADFLSPGLKVIDVHPFHYAANTPNAAAYKSIKDRVSMADRDEFAAMRFQGPGVATFLDSLLEFLVGRGERFYTLAELFKQFAPPKPATVTDAALGRHTEHTAEEHARYWSMSDQERQEFMRRDFDQRSPTDPYSTSRDIHLRELEIDSIRQQLKERGRILDLGCGNGYTLLSFARDLKDWEMIGVDYAPNLIAGAQTLMAAELSELRSTPQFICADAIEFVRECETDSFDYVITERFFINLPSKAAQRAMLAQIYRILTPGGVLLMCEAELDSFDRLNDVRESLGLSRVPTTSKENISSLRFTENEVAQLTTEIGFSRRGKLGYSMYQIISRVLHPLLVAPLVPRFDAKINELAREIQQCVEYQPGYGSNALWMLEKPQPME